FDGSMPGSRQHFTITGLKVDSFHTVQGAFSPLSPGPSSPGYFAWRRLQMNGSHLAIEGPKEQVHVKELSFDSEKEMVARGIEFESRSDSGHIKLSVPQLRMNAAWHSSDLSDVPVSSIFSDDIKLTFFQTSAKDTALVTTGAALHADNIHVQKGGIKYDSVRLDLRQTQVGKGRFRLHMPSSSLRLSNGHLTFQPSGGHPAMVGRRSLQTGILYSWNNAGVTFDKDSTSLAVGGLSGSFKKDTFRISAGASLSWRQAIAGLTITKGNLHYKGRKISADAGAYSWDPLDQVLRVKNFSVLLNTGR
ncbi:MAG: hypothetical protein ABUL46_01505, partial [Chitinophaga rupis]